MPSPNLCLFISVEHLKFIKKIFFIKFCKRMFLKEEKENENVFLKNSAAQKHGVRYWEGLVRRKKLVICQFEKAFENSFIWLTFIFIHWMTGPCSFSREKNPSSVKERICWTGQNVERSLFYLNRRKKRKRYSLKAVSKQCWY